MARYFLPLLLFCCVGMAEAKPLYAITKVVPLGAPDVGTCSPTIRTRTASSWRMAIGSPWSMAEAAHWSATSKVMPAVPMAAADPKDFRHRYSVTPGSAKLLFLDLDGPAGGTGEELAKEASVTMEQASALALEARPGEITDEELEREPGGSGLRYSFDIKSRGVTYEVGVDAKTGKILENRKEGPNPD